MTEPPVDVQRTSDEVPTGLKKPRFRSMPAWDVTQAFNIQTRKLDTLDRAAAQVDELLVGGVDDSVGQIQYLSTNLKTAKFAALRLATADAHATVRRRSRRASAAVWAACAACSEKDVTAVVSVTFAVDRG